MKIKFGDSSLNLKAGGSLANIDRGPRGYSAYEIAVQEGFVGTEEEWLASLVGPEGKQGKDGERGLEGPRGKEGPEGKQGIPGYTPVKGVDYFTEEDIESLNIPEKVSDLDNDSGYVNKSVNNLVNYTLKTNTGSLIDLSIDNTNYVVTLKLKNQDGTAISTDTIDLPLESVVVGGRYDSTNKKIVLTLENGNTVDIPVGDLIAGLQTEITSVNKLASDLVDDTNSGNKFTNISEKQTWNSKYDKPSSGIPATDLSSGVQTSLGKADTALQEHQDLTDYVKNTDYAADNKGGVTKNGNAFVVTNTNGVPYCSSGSYAQYQSSGNGRFISKGTLENVITGKKLVNQDALVQSQEAQDANIEENASNIDWLQTLVNQMPHISGQGTDLSLENVLNYRLMKFLPQGVSSQDGEPTPTTPIPIKVVTGENGLIINGTNLANPLLESGTIDATTGENVSNNAYRRMVNYIYFGNANTLYFKRTGNTTNMKARWYDENKNYIGSSPAIQDSLEKPLTPPTNAKYLRIAIDNNNSNYFTDYKVIVSTIDISYIEYEEQNYQLSLGNIELNSTPVGTIRDQIKGSGDVSYNLFNKDNANLVQKGIISSQGILTDDNDTRLENENLIFLTPGTYTISNTICDNVWVWAYDENKTYQFQKIMTTWATGYSYTFTISENLYIRFIWRKSDNSVLPLDDDYKILLTEGSEVKPYFPYGQVGMWYKREYIGKVVLDGSESWQNWSIVTSEPLIGFLLDDYVNYNNSNGNDIRGMSNYFKVVVNAPTTEQAIGLRQLGDGIKRVYVSINNSLVSNLENFKTWLSTHNTIVWYQKAEYTDIPITDTTLISQLNDIYNNAHSYNGVTNITTTYEDGNEQMYLDIEVLKNVWEVTE